MSELYAVKSSRAATFGGSRTGYRIPPADNALASFSLSLTSVTAGKWLVDGQFPEKNR